MHLAAAMAGVAAFTAMTAFRFVTATVAAATVTAATMTAATMTAAAVTTAAVAAATVTTAAVAPTTFAGGVCCGCERSSKGEDGDP